MSHNRLDYLPCELAHLNKLRELQLWDNPLSQLLTLKPCPLGESLVSFHSGSFQGSSLQMYLIELEDSGHKQSIYNKIKLMTLGSSGAGKTTLVDALEEYVALALFIFVPIRYFAYPCCILLNRPKLRIQIHTQTERPQNPQEEYCPFTYCPRESWGDCERNTDKR